MTNQSAFNDQLYPGLAKRDDTIKYPLSMHVLTWWFIALNFKHALIGFWCVKQWEFKPICGDKNKDRL